MNKASRIQTILADREKWQAEIARIGKACALSQPGTMQLGNDLIRATIRRAPVMTGGGFLTPDIVLCLDIMVIEVSPAARGNGVFLIWFLGLIDEIRTMADFKMAPSYLRFNKVINDHLEDFLLKLGAFIDGEYVCLRDFAAVRQHLARRVRDKNEKHEAK